eukprot:308466-Chlamydomonas_euryale.AAC.6
MFFGSHASASSLVWQTLGGHASACSLVGQTCGRRASAGSLCTGDVAKAFGSHASAGTLSVGQTLGSHASAGSLCSAHVGQPCFCWLACRADIRQECFCGVTCRPDVGQLIHASRPPGSFLEFWRVKDPPRRRRVPAKC